jgi:hypothetical protein
MDVSGEIAAGWERGNRDQYRARVARRAHEGCASDHRRVRSGKVEQRRARVGSRALLMSEEKGIRYVATDAPTLGGAEPMQALMTY